MITRYVLCTEKSPVVTKRLMIFTLMRQKNFIIEEMSQGTILECGGSGIDDRYIYFDKEDMVRHIELKVLTNTRHSRV